MASDTEHTCAIFFKVTGDQALAAVAEDMERLLVTFRSEITQSVSENGTVNGGSKKRYSDEAKARRVPWIEARKLVAVLPSLKVHRKSKWEDVK